MVSRSAILSIHALANEVRGRRATKHTSHAQYSGNRTKRVVGLLVGIAAVGLVDLHLTMREAAQAYFVEANPVAVAVLDGSPVSPGLFKSTLLGVGIAILLALRRCRSVEIGCWLLLGAHAGMLLCWVQYFAAVSEIDPTIHFDSQGNAWTAPPPGAPPSMERETPDPSQESGTLVDRSMAMANVFQRPVLRWIQQYPPSTIVIQ